MGDTTQQAIGSLGNVLSCFCDDLYIGLLYYTFSMPELLQGKVSTVITPPPPSPYNYPRIGTWYLGVVFLQILRDEDPEP